MRVSPELALVYLPSLPEHSTIRQCYSQLVNVVKQSYDTIGDALFSRGYISSHVRDFIRMDTKPPAEKARKLLDAVIDRVECHPDSYHGFIEILKKEGQWTEDMVKQLSDCYMKLLHSSSLPDTQLLPFLLSSQQKITMDPNEHQVLKT